MKNLENLMIFRDICIIFTYKLFQKKLNIILIIIIFFTLPSILS